jgi:ABC-type lipoprotein release transport system permease subunit
MAAAVSTLLIVTVVGCCLPAWRASQTDPAVSLRDA